MKSVLWDIVFVVIVLGVSLLLWLGIIALIINGFGWHLLTTFCAIMLLLFLTETTMKYPDDPNAD